MDSLGTGRRWPLLAGVCLAVAVALGTVVGWADQRGEGANGAGLTLDGRFYSLSSAEVRPESLGQVHRRQVPFQDTRADVRLIRGVDADTAVAAYVRAFPGTGATGDLAWLLLSPDAELAADPWGDPSLRPVVLPAAGDR